MKHTVYTPKRSPFWEDSKKEAKADTTKRVLSTCCGTFYLTGSLCGGFWVGCWTVWNSLSGEYTGTTICTGVCGEMLEVGGITGAWIRGSEAWPQVTAVTGGRRGRWDTLKAAEEVTPGLGRGRGRGQRGNLQSACGWKQEDCKFSPVTSYSLVMKVEPKEKVENSGWK